MREPAASKAAESTAFDHPGPITLRHSSRKPDDEVTAQIVAAPYSACALNPHPNTNTNTKPNPNPNPDHNPNPDPNPDQDLESHAEWMRAVSPGKPARHALLPVVWPQGGAIGGPGDLRGAPPRAVSKPPSPSQGDKSGKAKAKRAGARKPRAPAAARNQKS